MQESALGENVRMGRINAGVTQLALAKRSGISLRTIQDIEKGKGTTVATVYALAAGLGVTAGSLLDHPSPTEQAS